MIGSEVSSVCAADFVKTLHILLFLRMSIIFYVISLQLFHFELPVQCCSRITDMTRE